MKKMNVRQLVVLGGVMLMGIGIAGCSQLPKDSENVKVPEQAEVTGQENESSENSEEKAVIRFSWWGGDARHEKTVAAVEAFMKENPNIEVKCEYQAWTGYEDATYLAINTGNEPDVMQINWGWVYDYSKGGTEFLDLNQVSDIINLDDYDPKLLDLLTVDGHLEAIPVAINGRVVCWNKTTFDAIGVKIPESLDDLYAAGAAFKSYGEDYYPLALNELDRMIYMVSYLESKYGKNWVENNQLQYTPEEIKEGLEFIQKLEDEHVIPSLAKLAGDGADAINTNPNWIDGHYAGCYEWDSSIDKFEDNLKDGQEFVVGDFLSGMGDYQGGFTKIALGFAISADTKYPKECAQLIEYMMSGNGVDILGADRGIPASKTGLERCRQKDLLNPKKAYANELVVNYASFSLDRTFESPELKSTDGLYYDVFQKLSYNRADTMELAQYMGAEIQKVLDKKSK